MKFALVTLCLAVALVHANSEAVLGTCGGSCTTSGECAGQAEDTMCRCQNLVCTMVEDKCGGGCVTDGQCQDWAGGDETCVCSWLSCSRESYAKTHNRAQQLIDAMKNNIKTQKGRAQSLKSSA